MQKSSIKFNAVLNMFRMALTVLMPLVTFPYTSRIFLPEGSGRLNFASSVADVFMLFASLGIYTYGVREGARVRGNRIKFSQFAQELFSLNLAAVCIAYLVFFICLAYIPVFQRHEKLLLINSVIILFYPLGLDWVFGVYEEYVYITVRQIVTQVFIIIALFTFVHTPKDIYVWAGLSVVSSVGANIFNLFYAGKYVDYRPLRVRLGNLRRHLLPVLILFATQLAARVYVNLDTVLLGVMDTDRATGIYSAAVKVNVIMITCFGAMSPVFVPRIISYIEAGDSESYYRFVKKILQGILLLTVPSVVGILMLSGQIIVLIAGKAFADSAVTMRILCPIIFVTACRNVIYYNFLVPLKKEKNVLICTVAAALINLVVSAALIPSFHERGTAIGSLVAEVFAFCLAFVMAVRMDRNIIKTIPNPAPYLAGTLAIVLCCGVCRKIITGPALMLLASISCSVLSYAAVLLIFHEPVAINVAGHLIMKIKNHRGIK